MSAHPPKWLNDHEGDFIIKNYVFHSGETLPELKLHYRTLGISKRDAAGAAPALPKQLVEQIISAVETRREIGLNGLLQCARRLAEADKLAPTHTTRLCEALGDLLAETAYETVDSDSREAVSVSLIRAESVRLAHTLDNLGTHCAQVADWLSATDIDQLPEVGFALAN